MRGSSQAHRLGQRLAYAAFVVLGFAISGCDWMPGAPKEEDRWKPKTEIVDFDRLYSINCLACHSNGKTLSASIPMNDPLYTQLVPEDKLRSIIENGVPGTPMPAFGAAAGGSLTEEQINVLVKGILAWRSNEPAPADLPPYEAPIGNVAAGAQAYAVYCASCHGPDGKGGADAPNGPIVDPAYLGLVSDQYLRTVTIIGRPQLGMPDYRSYVQGRSMTAQEIADVVAWMASHRVTPTPQPSDLQMQ